MPEMTFTVRWPDGAEAECYSPSLVMHDHLEVGGVYPLADFVGRTSAALDEASERVRAKFGFVCTSAMAQREAIHQSAGRYPDGGLVRVIAMHPPLPHDSMQESVAAASGTVAA